MINEDIARAVRKSWQEKMRNPNNALEIGRTLWQLSLSEAVAAAWFRDAFLQEAFLEICSRAVKRQEIETTNTEKILRESFYRLANLNENGPYVFNAEGSDKKTVTEALETTYCAFSKTFMSGEDIGRTVLCFTETSLLRFLKTASMSKKLLAAFFDCCKEKGVWREQNKIRLSEGGTERYYVFFVDELIKYRSEADK